MIKLIFALILFLSPREGKIDASKIMKKVLSRSSFKTVQAKVTLKIIKSNGSLKKRVLKMWSKTNDKDETRFLMRFIYPNDVKGTGFLTIEHNDKDNDMFFFLPAIRKVNRIAGSEKGSSFMGSEFTYYDIGKPKYSDWNYKFVKEDKIDGKGVYVIEGTPKNDKVYKETKYYKIVWHVLKDKLVSKKIEYFDNRKVKFKELNVLKFQDIKGVPFAVLMEMTNVFTKDKSVFEFSDLKVDEEIDDSVFTLRNLIRWY